SIKGPSSLCLKTTGPSASGGFSCKIRLFNPASSALALSRYHRVQSEKFGVPPLGGKSMESPPPNSVQRQQGLKAGLQASALGVIRTFALSLALSLSSVSPAIAAAEPQSSRPPHEDPIILTPRPPRTPRINGARIFGVRPNHPFLFTIPATGERPMRFV